jgi:hypothetical protein
MSRLSLELDWILLCYDEAIFSCFYPGYAGGFIELSVAVYDFAYVIIDYYFFETFWSETTGGLVD